MGSLQIHQELVTEAVGKKMCELCPFHAISYDGKKLEITAGCRMCRLCVKNGIPGVITFEETKEQTLDKTKWQGITVFVEQEEGRIHPVSYELLGKAKELSQSCPQQVLAVVIGYGMGEKVKDLISYGADKIYYYEHFELEEFDPGLYTNILQQFIEEVHPSVFMFGATIKGRSLAPRAAARFGTGLTADCTSLLVKDNTDLVQIRPAFGGNIMAQIVTPGARPQFCTVRYKVFDAAAENREAEGEVVYKKLSEMSLRREIRVKRKIRKPDEIDISEAQIIVAVGRGVKDTQGLKMAKELADMLHAQLACTRPLVEKGWFDARRQIGLSGRTVKPKLLITLGISGSVQFAAGMKGAERIIAVNSDKNAAVFDIAHYGFVGDLYEVVPGLLRLIKGEG
ncbi:electron transfer flavoprotein subunit alpha/FixB family protein [Ruminococcus sp. CLA-AA-H200]|uniref:Electron transfer flavoprotein subunit alpha/FixB family protein n=1 Tax=Ruminococcus turbiniformis TaxID=2881258 RepID=A0ABS8G1V4_9FIRM|nr:electron transfer flavoprotein subunit alpha/FixB family protein [Ruminococcus turbiniformis]MCC2256253.1 electron transfer flavoprotein subunit alpha/FixB family protein [Ruminococcus turbiniformis]